MTMPDSTLIDPVVDVAESAPRNRGIWPLVVAAVVVLALIGAGTTAVVYAHTYQPLSQGEGFGPLTPSIRAISDGTVDTRFILVGPTGTTGVVDYTVANSGSHPVRLLGLDKADAGFFTTGLKWASLSFDNIGEGTAQGTLRDARAFPVTLQPNESVFIQLSVIQPRCSPGISLSVTGIPLRWSALGVHHVWTEVLGSTSDGGGYPLQIALCPSKAAIAHIDTF
jgi:hypothetical protein